MTLPGFSSYQEKKPHLTHKKDVFHAWMLKDLEFSKNWELPKLKTVNYHPCALIPFSEAIKEECIEFDCYVHFFEDDRQYEELWDDPKKYLKRLKQFAGVIMPDFSTSIDFPRPLKLWNCYRNQLLGAWFEKEGLNVIPNARHQPDCDWLIEAIPKRSVIAICGRSLVQRKDERKRFIRDLKTTVDMLKPTAIVYYGSDSRGALDYPRQLKIPIWVYPGCGRGTFDGARSGQR